MKKRTLYGEVPNLVGQRFGKLFVVRIVGKRNKSYLCKCDCGTERSINGKKLLLDDMKSCGCERGMRPPNDLMGYRFGNWTVIGKADEELCKRQVLWKCMCDCGGIVNKTPYAIRNHVHKMCGVCSNTGNKKQVGEITNRYWKRVVDSARVRNIPLEITKSFAWELFLKQDRRCVLTGILLTFANSYEGKEAILQTASLDRIDSNIGYINTNVQWVHKAINKMKNSLSDEDLIEWCQRVVEHKKNSL
jgi:hypothetical protein